MEGLAEQLNLILQRNEALNTTLAHERNRINALEAEFSKLTNYTVELERKIGTTSSTPSADQDIKRIMNTNLLKGQEMEPFNKKDNYEIWIDGVKNDLYSQLPDAEPFTKYAEDTNRTITPIELKADLEAGHLGPFNCTPKTATLINF